MKKNYTIIKFYVCFLILLFGFSYGTAQISQKNYSLLPAPNATGENNKPATSFPILTNGSIAYGNNIQASDFYSFDIDDPTNWASVATVSFLSYSGDFATNDTEHLWIIDGNDNYLKKILVSDASIVKSVYMPCPLVDGVWTVLTFHKTTGQLFAIATSNTVSDSRLYKIDLADGTATELFQLGSIGIVSGTFDMDGNLYAFDYENDSIYNIDVYDQSIETLGYAGFDGNYIQGMGCDSETNQVYLAAFQASIAAELRLLDKNTGNTTFISTLPNETGAFGFPVTGGQQEVHSVHGVYTDTGNQAQSGDIIWVYGYYTDTAVNLMVENYSDWISDQILPPQSVIALEGTIAPSEAQNGGLIYVKGELSFENVPFPPNPEDTVMAHLEVMEVFVMFDGLEDDSPPKKEIKEKKDQGSFMEAECDSCKFAVLISGGYDTLNNHSKYWENLVALYNFKVDSQGYCKDNVFVHYFKGDRRDNRIPADRVSRCDSAKIEASLTEISNRVAACTKAGKMSTLQKMVTNHGEASGDIDMLKGEPALKPAYLRDWQQKVIDSCCSLVYDEFVECYGGIVVDTMLTLDPLNKAKIYANSNADNQTGISPHDQVHPYLKAKIDALDNGLDYEDAVVNGKLAYDAFLQKWVDKFHDWAQWYRINSHVDSAAIKAAKWAADSAYFSDRICKSRNVAITPMKEYCQLEKFVVPPGGQLVLKFEGKNNHCGNVTVYRDGKKPENKYRVFNWNNPGSARYEEGNNQRVVNGHATDTTIFWVHNDDGEFVIRSSANGNQDLDESDSNISTYPGSSFGGNDNSADEFSFLPDPFIWIENIEQVPFDLSLLPAYLGGEFTGSMGGSFTVDPFDIYATQMVLHLDILEVIQPGTISINSSGSAGLVNLSVFEPGIYEIPLGDMTFEAPYAFIEIIGGDAIFCIDCWGVHTAYQPLMLDINIFLQGPFADGNMQPGLLPFIPLDQPFNAPPWDYPGNESVSSLPNTDVIDWLLMELRVAQDPLLATPGTVIARKACFLLNDGSITGTDGDRNDAIPFAIPEIPPSAGNLYVVIWHRNHLGVMSAYPLFGTGILSYDFTTGPGQAFGLNAMVGLGDGVFGLRGGDSNADGVINGLDKASSWDQETGESGYLGSDSNLDGQANNQDKNDVWLNNLNAQTQVPN